MKTGIAYSGVKDVDHVRKDMEELAAGGYTHVLHPYSEEDFLYHQETMKEIIAISKECGLQVYVSTWGVGKVFSGEALSELSAGNSVQSQVDNRGEKMVASCINNETFRTYMRSWVEAVCETEADTILWDNPRFYIQEEEDRWCCRCDTCQKIFRKQTRHLMPNGLTESVESFRKGTIVEFLSEITGLAHVKGKRNSVCFDVKNEKGGYGFLDEIADLPTIDELGLKPYWKRGDRPADISKSYHHYSKELLAVTKEHHKEAQIWVKNFSIAKNNEESVAEATYAAYNEGVRNIFSWSFKGSKCLSALRSDDVKTVHKIQSDAFSECQEKALMNQMIDTMKNLNTQ